MMDAQNMDQIKEESFLKSCALLGVGVDVCVWQAWKFPRLLKDKTQVSYNVHYTI